jgi:DNA-binding transcriptional MerR regulator
MTDIATSVRSGEMAELTAVSADTLRYYERIGILARIPRTTSGYRLYSRDAVVRVRVVRGALQMGFTLAELATIFRVCDSDDVPSQSMLDMTREKLRSIEGQIEELRRTERYMRQILREWRLRAKQRLQQREGCRAIYS